MKNQPMPIASSSLLLSFAKKCLPPISVWLAFGLALASGQAAIIFDDFNVSEGHFTSAPDLSSTTVGEGLGCTADRVITTGPLEGIGHQKLVLNSDGLSTLLRVRHLSGGGTPANNIAFTTGAGVDGWIGFYLKSTVAGMAVSINLDGAGGTSAEMDGSASININPDGLWHLYEWNLDATTGWGVVAGIGGGHGTAVPNGTHTIDSIYVRDLAGTPSPSGTYYLDFVAKSDSGSIASLPTINKLDQTITFGSLSNKSYGDTFNPGATADSGLTVTYSIISGSATVSGSTVTVTGGSGTVTVRASQAGNGTYNAAPDVDRTFTAAPAPLTITADDATRPYGAANPAFTASYDGFKLGETLNTSDLSGAPDLTTLADSSSAPGVHAITTSVGTLASANYSFTLVDGSLTVTQELLTVTADDISRLVGGNNPTLTSTITGFANGETVAVLSGSPLLATTATPASPAGTYPITASLGDLSSANYSFAFQDGIFTVIDYTTNSYLLHPSDLATSKPDFSPPHGAGANSFSYDWDSIAPDAGYGAPAGYGESSFSANVTQAGANAADRYRTFRVGFRTLFGHNVNIADIAAISYKTKKGTTAAEVDWRLTIYTTTNASPGNAASWYRSRLQSTPALALGLNAPAGQWNTWATDSGDNQLQFKDNRAGFTTENILWSELVSGPVTRGATWDWTAEEVMMMDITLGADSGGGNALSQLDAVRIVLNDGQIADINLEQTTSTTDYEVTPAQLAVGKSDFSPPHGTGVNPFAFDWDSSAPDSSCGGAPGYGQSSFSANVTQAGATVADRYRTLRLGLRTLFGHNVNVGEVAAISYKTKKGTTAAEVDWRLTIYTATNASPGNLASWYRSRLQSTPSLALGLNAPAGQWNTWSTASGDNQFQFKDNRTGFTTENILWSELASGPVTRGATWDWTAEEIMMIDITLGANSGGGNALSQLDGVRIRLSNGEVADINLEGAPFSTPSVYINPDYTSVSDGSVVTFPNDPEEVEHIVGCDAFGTIQAGIDAVATNGTVNVAPGNYNESLNISKPMTLLGANAGIAGCNGRGAESAIDGGAGVAVTIAADNVTVDGFGLTGAIGLRAINHVGVVAQNNAITAATVGVDVEAITTTASATVTLQGNCVTLTSQLAGSAPTIGVYLSGISGPQGLDLNTNTVSGAFYGYVLYNVNASASTLVRGGTVAGAMQGVAVFNIDPVTFSAFSPTKFGLDGVNMSGFTGNYPSSPNNNFHAGVYVFTGGSDLAAQVTGSVNNLTITGTGKISADSAAIYLGDFSTGVGTRQQISVDSCIISDNLNRGISMRGSNVVTAVSRCNLSDNGSDPFGAGGNDGFGIAARLGATVTVTESFIANPASVTAPYHVYGLFTGETPFPSMTVNRCALSNNGNPSGRVANAYNGTINASGNWWDDNTPAGIAALATANVDYTPWLAVGTDTSGAPGFQGDFTTLNVDDNSPQTGATGRIQEGVDLVSGSTVLVGPGSYSENVVITNKVTIEGAGSGSNPAVDTVVTSAVANTPVVRISAGGTSAADRLTLRNLRLTGATGSGNSGAGISLLAGGSFYDFENVVSTGNGGHGLAVNHLGANNDVLVTQCSFSGNAGTGFRIPTGAGMDGLTINLSHFDGNAYGLESYMGNGSGTVFQNVNISDSSFDNNTFKGIYVEKLSDALWQCLSVTNSGTSGSFAAGIDINLKYAAYQNIQILNSTITGCGTSDSVNGAGVTVKARDDAPSYSGNPASLNNLTLSGLIISGSPDAIRLGETAKNNSGPLNASVSYCSLSGNTRGLRNESLSLTDADTNWWGSVTGPTAVSNPGGSGVFASANVDFSPWLGTSADTSLACGFQPNPAIIHFTAANLVFVTQPAGAGDGQPFTTQPVVHVLDENGDLATAFNGSVSLRVTNNTIGGTLIGINEVNAINGVAGFSGLSVTPAGIFTLIADSAGLGSATSDPFEVFGLPVIIIQPQDVVGPVNQGSNVTFSVVAINGTLTYQWRTNGTPVSGATGSSLVWANTQPADTALDFSVEVFNEAGSIISDSASILAVKPDSTAPFVTVITPVKNKGTNLDLINVTGVVKDTGSANSGIITAVKFVHNGGLTQDATFTPGATAGTWNFTSASPITLTPGTNTMSVWAIDLASNVSVLDPFVFFYDLTNTLTLNINGNGNVKLGTAIYNGPTTNIAGVFKVGRPYRLDAYVKNGTNYIFSSWVTSPLNPEGYSTNDWVKQASLSFVMQENMVIDANFIVNPFTSLAGRYNGLFSDPLNVTHETAGFFQVLVKDKATYSGYLYFDGFKRPFSGKFNLSGTTTTTVTRSKFVPQSPVQLSLNLDGELITGSVSDASVPWVSEASADKSIFSLSNLQTTNRGKYTFQIPASPGAPSSSPGGIGYGTVTNNSLGMVTLAGSLSDGEKIGQKVSMSRHGQWPFYVPLYKNAAKEYKGSLIGWVTFTNADFGPSTDNVLTWIKKDGSASLTRYGAGFSNSVEIVGSPYLVPAPNTLPVPMSVGDWIILRDGNLSEPVTNTISSITGNRVNFWATNTLGNGFYAGAIGFKPKTGAIYPLDRTTIQGVVLQNTTGASGFFLGPTETGSMTWEKK